MDDWLLDVARLEMVKALLKEVGGANKKRKANDDNRNIISLVLEGGRVKWEVQKRQCVRCDLFPCYQAEAIPDVEALLIILTRTLWVYMRSR
jgi:hypothetical protein